MQRDIKIKEIDSDTQIAIKNIELDIQREINKCVAMEQGCDLAQFMDNVKKCVPNKYAPKKSTRKQILDL